MNAIVQVIEELTKRTKDGRLLWGSLRCAPDAWVTADHSVTLGGLELKLTAHQGRGVELRHGQTVLVDSNGHKSPEAEAAHELCVACGEQRAAQFAQEQQDAVERLMSVLGIGVD